MGRGKSTGSRRCLRINLHSTAHASCPESPCAAVKNLITNVQQWHRRVSLRGAFPPHLAKTRIEFRTRTSLNARHSVAKGSLMHCLAFGSAICKQAAGPPRLQ
jgi:hypothetical protein